MTAGCTVRRDQARALVEAAARRGRADVEVNLTDPTGLLTQLRQNPPP